jgi:hypothetical protein
MKTTLILPDPLFERLKRRALESGSTLSALVSELLHRGLDASGRRRRPPRRLPSFDGGRPAVDPADREELYRAMEGR